VVEELPVGPVALAATERGIYEIVFLRGRTGESPATDDTASARAAARKHLRRCRRQLERYFAGKPTTFDVPLDLSRGTAFQQTIWRACMTIPPGETRPYGELARAAGRPGAARAVGAAMGANPVPIIVPCHRVVRSDGSLGGYGSGLPVKRALLKIEGVNTSKTSIGA
jgi:methylated-DNA-[protein]-cysteine S-methyltransferase